MLRNNYKWEVEFLEAAYGMTLRYVSRITATTLNYS